jgi:hypothetical protein
MKLCFILLIYSHFLLLTIAWHFLGGSFTYRHHPSSMNRQQDRSILVEIRFHISNHYFMCTPMQVNEHFHVYLVGENILVNESNGQYLWHDAQVVKHDRNFYRIKCIDVRTNTSSCQMFNEDIWAYCESANDNSGYSILRRQFLFNIEQSKSIVLAYVCRLTRSCSTLLHEKIVAVSLSYLFLQMIKHCLTISLRN